MFKLFKKKIDKTGLSINDDISIKMKRMLEKSGHSEKEVADIIGVSVSTVNKWLNKKSSPKVSDFFKFCKACGYEIVAYKKD